MLVIKREIQSTLTQKIIILPFIENKTQCTERHFEIYWKSQFDVRIQELVSKVQNTGPFLRKTGLNTFFSDFLFVAWVFLHKPPWNFGSRAKIDFSGHLILQKKSFLTNCSRPPILTKKQPKVAIFDKTYFWGLRYPLMVLPQRLGNKGYTCLYFSHCTKSGGSTLVAPGALLVPSSAPECSTAQCSLMLHTEKTHLHQLALNPFFWLLEVWLQELFIASRQVILGCF